MATPKGDNVDVTIIGPHLKVEGTIKIPTAAHFEEFLKNQGGTLPVHKADFYDVLTKEHIESAKFAYLNMDEFLAVIPKKPSEINKDRSKASDLATLDTLMTKKLVTAKETDTLHDAFQLMSQNDIHHLPVIHNRQFTGLISKSDVRMHLFNQHDEMVRKFMKKKIVVASPDDTLGDAVRNMAKSKITCLPILDGKRLVGIITNRDLIRILAAKL